ncbi:MAG: metal ABC transporter ATP-binding protein [Promethearchaeota archaeon]
MSDENEKSNEENDVIIELKDISVGFNNLMVLDNINLKVRRGEYIGLIGKNGSGKTTLMKTILGLVKPLKGEVKIFNKEVTAETYEKIGYVPQMHTIKKEFPATVSDIVQMGLYRKVGLFKPLKKKDMEKVQLAIHKVKMESYINRPIGHLSGGEQQKVLIAHALVKEPEILLLDEPTSALDFTMVKDLMELLSELNRKYKITLIVIHHNLEILRPYCSRLIMLKGRIMYDGDPLSPKADEMLKEVFFY